VVADKLAIAGQGYQIVLPQTRPIPTNAVFRQLRNTDLWTDFVENAENQLMSSAGAPGYCPPPGDNKWISGLKEGYWCVQLQLNDGGPNDIDGEANGTIVAPGGVATLTNNSQPTANDDVAETHLNTAITINVLANDADADADPLSLRSATATLGTAEIVDNKLHYQPAQDLIGEDTVVYGISDGSGGSASATLTITVLAAAPPPVVIQPPAPTPTPVANNSSSSGGGALLWVSLLLLLLGGVRRTYY
jgi:hypothetical protein